MSDLVVVRNDGFWVKRVGMLQQHWVIIEAGGPGKTRVYFISDTIGVSDEIAFPTDDEARDALHRNGFRRFAEDKGLQSFLRPPSAPFRQTDRPNGPIYSSGRFWQ